jgi:hypothetical protein
VGDWADLGTNRCPLNTGIAPGLVAADPWLMSRRQLADLPSSADATVVSPSG